MVQYFPIVTGSLTVTGSVLVSGSITTNSTITATTLVVQTITSSISAITGSTNFGSLLTNTHVFSGSVTMNPGGLFVSGSGNTGVGILTPRTRFQVAGLTGGAVPGATGVATLGLANSSSVALFTNLDPDYGTLFGTLNTGVGWIQQQRVDGTATAYNLLLQPNGGNVGIGTSSPTDNIIGSGTFLDISSTTGGALKLHYSPSSTYGELSLYKGSNGSYIDSAGASTVSNNDIKFRTGGTSSNFGVTTRMIIGASGKVECINGPSGDWGFTVVNSSGASNSFGISVSAGANSSDVSLNILDRTSTTVYFRVRGDGAVFLSSNYPFTTASGANLWIDSSGVIQRNVSSIKYKKDVQDYDKGLVDLMKLRPVSYLSKSEIDNPKRYAGMIAEELHELGFSEYVNLDENGEPDSISYASMVAILTKSIQELNTKFEDYKATHP